VPLALAQYVYADPQLQWLVDHRASRSHGGWAFGLPVTDVGLYRRPAGAVPAIEPTDFLGCVRLPVSPLHFARSMGEASVGAGLRASPSGEAVSPEEAAPLICFRSGFEPFDDYLLLVGLHAQTEDLMAFPNAIGRFTAEGHVWLLQNTERLGPYYLNAGYVSDGQPPTGVQPYARVLACCRLPEGGMTATRAENYNGVDWTRSLFWRRNGFFVVLDRLQPRADAQSDRWSTQCVWRTPSSARWDGRTWTSAQGPARLVLQHSTPIPATSQQENEVDPVGPPLPYVLRQRQPLDGREGVAVYQNLLYIRGPHHHNRLELRRWNDDAVLLRGRVAGEDYLARSTLLAARGKSSTRRGSR
jgi:hypothetical protein